jgi:hypothetical protein
LRRRSRLTRLGDPLPIDEDVKVVRLDSTFPGAFATIERLTLAEALAPTRPMRRQDRPAWQRYRV